MRFGNFLIALLVCGTFCTVSQAADYYVSANGNDSNPGSSSAPWRTIAKANRTVRAGDTITMRGGEYKEAIKPERSGTPSAPIRYRAQPGETVVLTLPPTDSEGKKTAIRFDSRSYIIVEGISVDGKRLSGGGEDSDVDSFIRMNNSHFNEIRDCDFRFANGNAGVHINGGSSHNRIINNTFDAVGTNHIPDGYPNAGTDRGDILVIKNASHNVIEGNRFSRGGHNILDLIGSYNVVRGNSFDGKWTGTESPASRAAGALSANVKYDVPGPRGFNLFESNIVKNAGSSSDNPDNVGLKVQGTNQIVRANYFFDNKSAAISASTRPGSSERVQHNRIYNNTFFQSESLFIYRDYGHDFPFNDNVWKNNLVAGIQSDVQAVINLTSLARINGDATDEIGDTTIAGNIFEKAGGGAQAVLKVKVADTFVSDTFQAMERRYPKNVYANVTADIQFQNAAARSIAGFDVRLGSAAIDAGVPLTTTTAAGSGRIVKVRDARYFYDGFGISGEVADSVVIGNAPAVRIVSVDYVNNELILEASIAWASNAPVNLQYSGAAPDVGAHEISSDIRFASRSLKPLPPLLLSD